LPGGAEKAVFIAQAMDSAGNISHNGNKGRFFGSSEGETTVYLPLILNEAR